MKIAYKKPRCPIPYEKNLKTNFYEWFTKRGEVKTKDAHVIELGTWVQITILENNHVLKVSMVAML